MVEAIVTMGNVKSTLWKKFYWIMSGDNGLCHDYFDVEGFHFNKENVSTKKTIHSVKEEGKMLQFSALKYSSNII